MSIASGVRSKTFERGWPIVGIVVILVVALSAAACGQGRSGAANPSAGTQLTSEEQVQRIAPTEAKALLDQGKAVLYDVRSEELYNARHAAGAQSLPLAEIEARLASIPKDKILILYCT